MKLRDLKDMTGKTTTEIRQLLNNKDVIELRLTEKNL